MGRPRKFRGGDVVWFEAEGYAPDGTPITYKQYGVVVGYARSKRLASQPGYYKVVRLTAPAWTAQAWGGAVWRKSNEVHKAPVKHQRGTVLRRYRVNRRIPERGCYCNCCIHVKIPPSHVRDDGTFTWEEPKEE